MPRKMMYQDWAQIPESRNKPEEEGRWKETESELALNTEKEWLWRNKEHLFCGILSVKRKECFQKEVVAVR